MALFTENALNMTFFTKLTVFTAAGCFLAYPASAQEASTPGFGGPDAVENQLAEDRLTWNERRNEWKDKYGFGVSFDYTSVVLSANETFSDSTGAGGIARLYGAWDLVGEGAGSLVWKFEHRHAYGDTSPFDFSMGSRRLMTAIFEHKICIGDNGSMAAVAR